MTDLVTQVTARLFPQYSLTQLRLGLFCISQQSIQRPQLVRKMAVLPSPLLFIASIPPVTRGFTAATVVLSLLYAWLVWTGATVNAPYLTVVPGSSLFYPWTFVTSVLVETSIFEVSRVCPSLNYSDTRYSSS